MAALNPVPWIGKALVVEEAQTRVDHPLHTMTIAVALILVPWNGKAHGVEEGRIRGGHLPRSTMTVIVHLCVLSTVRLVIKDKRTSRDLPTVELEVHHLGLWSIQIALH